MVDMHNESAVSICAHGCPENSENFCTFLGQKKANAKGQPSVRSTNQGGGWWTEPLYTSV